MARFRFSAGWIYLLFLVYNAAVGRALAARASSPSALRVDASESWEGDDGEWSSFTLSVGTPSQHVNVLVSNTQPMPWVIDDYYACINPSDTCKSDRGGAFKNSTSTTWSFEGINKLVDPKQSLEGWLGYSGNGYMGNDTVGLGWIGSAVTYVKNQMIAATPGGAKNEFYMGYIGLFPRPLNLSNWEYVTPSFLQNLQTQGYIPSLSWGYTAGARSHVPLAYGSLTLGGYDQTMFKANGLSFPFGADQSRDLLVWVKNIQTSSVVANSQASKTLSDASTKFEAAIDFTLPYIWVTEDIYTKFEAAFGLVWNEESSLYLINDTQHEALLAANPNVTFTLGSDTFTETVDIVMPYTHFDLTAKPPLVPSIQRYFPLKRAQTSNQTVLGRAFMQSAYVAADYSDGRNNFTVAQAQFVSTKANHTIVTIYPPGVNPDSKQSLSTGAIAGVAVGAIVAISIVGACIFLYFRRKRIKAAEAAAAKDNEAVDPYANKPELEANEVDHTRGKHEVDGLSSAINEVDGHAAFPELMDNKEKVHEMSHEHVIYEMPAEPVILPELESPMGTQVTSTPMRMVSDAGDTGNRTEEETEAKPKHQRFSYETGEDH